MNVDVDKDDIYAWDHEEVKYYNIPLYQDPRYELIAMISEVHNTPWGQVTYYVHPIDIKYRIPLDNNQNLIENDQNKKYTLPFYDVAVKKMHVSPFFGMNYRYQVEMGECEKINIEMHELLFKEIMCKKRACPYMCTCVRQVV